MKQNPFVGDVIEDSLVTVSLIFHISDFHVQIQVQCNLIADERVDFRQLIKVLAEAFRVRIEMKQIGARQETATMSPFSSLILLLLR